MSSSAARSPSFAAVALAASLILTSLLLGLAFVQSHHANRLLLAGNLLAAAEEFSHPESAEPETAILLALESYRLDPTIRSLDLLRALLDPLSPRPAIRIPLGSNQAVWRLHPGGERLTLLDRGKAQVIQIASGRLVRAFDTGDPFVAALSPDGLTVAALSQKGTLTVWDARSAQTIDSWVFSGNAAPTFRISNDARVLALADSDATVHLIQRPRTGLWRDRPFPPPASYDGSIGYVEAYLAEGGSRLALWYYSRIGMHENRCAWRLYDTRTGKTRDEDSYSESNCEDLGVVLSPSGRYLADLADGNLVVYSGRSPTQPNQGRRTEHVTFSPGESLIAIEEAAAIRVESIGARPRPRASERTTLPRAADGETVLSVSDALPNRNPLLVTQDGNRVAIRDLPSGRTLYLVPFPEPVLEAALTRDHRFLVASTPAALFAQRLDDADRRVWNHDASAIRDLQITPDGKRLLTIGDNDNFYAWNLQSGQRVAKKRLDQEVLMGAPKLRSIHQSAGGSFILLQVLDTNQESHAFGGPADQMLSRTGALPDLPDLEYHQVWFGPQDAWAMAMETVPQASFGDLEVLQLTPKGMRPHHAIQASASSIPRFNPDASYFATDTPDGVQVVNTRTSQATILRRDGDDGTQFAFSPVGSMLAVVGRDAGYQLWDYRTSKIISARPVKASGKRTGPWVQEAFFSAKGRYLAVAATPVSYVFEVASGRALASFHTLDSDSCSSLLAGDIYGYAPPHGAQLQLSPDERYATGCDAGQVVLVDLRTGRRSAASLAGVGAFHLAPPYLAVAAGHRVTLLHVDTMTPLARIDHGDTVSGVFFTPGQKQLVIWGGATIRRERCWGSPAAEACRKLTRNLTPQEWRTHLGELPYRKSCPSLP